ALLSSCIIPARTRRDSAFAQGMNRSSRAALPGPRRLLEHDRPGGHRRRRLGRLAGKESGVIVRTIGTSAHLLRSLAVATLVLAVGTRVPAAWDQGPKQPADPYDPGKMDLKPPPARLSAERHQGAFAEGSALSLGAELKPLDPAPVKTVRLDTVHKIIEIAPG